MPRPLQGRLGHESTAVCDQQGGGMDSVLAQAGTALFWLSILPLAHMALRVVVPSVPSYKKHGDSSSTTILDQDAAGDAAGGGEEGGDLAYGPFRDAFRRVMGEETGSWCSCLCYPAYLVMKLLWQLMMVIAVALLVCFALLVVLITVAILLPLRRFIITSHSGYEGSTAKGWLAFWSLRALLYCLITFIDLAALAVAWRASRGPAVLAATNWLSLLLPPIILSGSLTFLFLIWRWANN